LRLPAERRGLATASTLGCPDPKTAAECLRGKPFQSLAGLYEDQVGMHRWIADLPWQPVAGTALPLQPLTALRLGLAAGVPLIQGGTRDEMRPFVAGKYDGARPPHPVTAAEYPHILRDLYGPGDAETILAKYPRTNRR
jgi:para-nitrobenzyl esterase